MSVNAFLEPVTFGNGENISIQGSEFHYCSPRTTGADSYRSVEVGNTTMKLPSRWNVYKDDDGFGSLGLTVYACVPAVLVHELIKSNGGIVSGECPPLQLDTYNK